LGAAAGALIVGTPYVFGGLLLLESHALMQVLGGWLTAGESWVAPAVLEFVGRVFVVFCVNEAVAQRARPGDETLLPLKSARAHLSLLAVAVAAIAAPPDRGVRVGRGGGGVGPSCPA
jgi:hypothetical protein